MEKLVKWRNQLNRKMVKWKNMVKWKKWVKQKK